ncbi:transporter [Hahella sp. SMD15-11]|uniref:Transporter n=1 Tax=Thermohahella caldifontis TaxID=3142973 RepID=A0AB39UZD8_9GAMM
MKRWVLLGLIGLSSAGSPLLQAAEKSSVDQAREALAKQDEGDEAKKLEEVFTATEKNYSLLKKGKMSLNYGLDYSYFGDQRLDVDIVNGSIRNFDVTPDAQHTFTNSFTFDYGVLNNLTLSTRVPLVVKYESSKNLVNTDMGDVSFTLRWQPFAYVPGKPSYTFFGTLKSKTGVSPYEIDVERQLASGAGYYSVSFGASGSKVLDPVIVFGSVTATLALPETGLNQVRGGNLLVKVDPGNTLSVSAGFSYALSYDVSLSISNQISFTDQTTLTFLDGREQNTMDSLSATVNFSLGVRVSDTKLITTYMGFGLTEDSPDVMVGLSIPINIEGLKEQ